MMVNNFAALYNYTTVDQATESMMTSTNCYLFFLVGTEAFSSVA